jgi:hypothetical protein
MKIQHAPLEYVNQVWPKVVKFIDASIVQQDGEPDYTLDQVRTLVVTGQWVLLVVVDVDNAIKGAITVSFMNRPNHRVAFITNIGGKLIVHKHTFNQLLALLKTMGATSIEGAVNDSVARLWRRFGFTEKYKIVGVTI